MTPTHPRELSPEWRERFAERAAIVHEGNRIPETPEGVIAANRLAFGFILAEMERENRPALPSRLVPAS